MTRHLPSLQQRIKRIQDEVRGVISQSGITQWELQFMKDLQDRNIAFGSDRQIDVIARIERKVFGSAEE